MSGSEHSQNLPIEQVQHSETQKEIKSETIYQLKLANQILERYKNKYGANWSKFEQAKKEYNDIKIATIEALKSERAIIQSELQSIQKEVGDLKNIESLSDRWFNTKPAYIDEGDQMDFWNASETTKEQDKNSENISISEIASTAIKQIASKTIQATNEIIF